MCIEKENKDFKNPIEYKLEKNKIVIITHVLKKI